MKIAIVGSGISGLVAAHRLHSRFQVTVFEADNYAGGHTNTIDVERDGQRYAVDTGFIVFNDRTYPNFLNLLRELKVAYRPTSMSFSFRSDRAKLEYATHDVNGLFAQRRNALRPSFWRMLLGIRRFRREAPALLTADYALSLRDYLTTMRYPTEFVEQFLIPMGAAIWSTSPDRFGEFPARHFAQFFENHGTLHARNQPQWYVVSGGSQQYVRALIQPLRGRIRLNSPVQRIVRDRDGVDIQARDGSWERFDHVILATHSDQALRVLASPTERETSVLSAIPYTSNTAVLHTDTRLLPRRRTAWASWNYCDVSEADGVAVTYDMNRLQGLRARDVFCVTLNHESAIAPEKVLRKIQYAHPLFTAKGFEAQRRHAEISGQNRTHYCGAYWGNGFHEDGVVSALRVCQYFEQEKVPCKAASMKDTSTTAV